MARILIRNALVVATCDEQLGEIEAGDVLVEGKTVARVGQGLDERADEVIDAAGKVVVPGFVNTHHHLYQVLTRCLPAVQDVKLFDWLTYLYDVWSHVTPEDLHAAARAGLAELLLTGCTQCADHHYLCPECAEGDPFEAEARAAAEIGIRLHMTRGSMSLGQSAGGLPPDSVIQDEQRILDDSARVVDRFHDPEPQSMCRVALAPCSPFSVTPDLMRSVADLARREKVRLHTHLAETLDEESFCLERFGKRPLALMEDLGWVGPDVWFAHCVHLSEPEIARMAETGTGVAHCPVSNLRLGSGIAPVPAMLRAGVPVGLAVDGSASNDSSNMLRELQLAMLVHRVGTAVEAMPARTVLQMATLGGSRVLGRDDTGRLAPGMSADLAVFDLSGLAYAGALSDPLAALLFCGLDQRADLVMVNGELVVREGRLVRADEADLAEAAREASRALLASASAS
ncbi:MAG: 8-oxoguanine deaminase [Deltaproteobacteria bacterium]|nr:8-oxoguanine deaminase [Deltaproteobacteria bacterium]